MSVDVVEDPARGVASFVVIDVFTDDEMTPLTSKSFRPENLRTDLYISSWGPTQADAIDDEYRKGCVPHRPAYA